MPVMSHPNDIIPTLFPNDILDRPIIANSTVEVYIFNDTVVGLVGALPPGVFKK
jgi:hypothetical protein